MKPAKSLKTFKIIAIWGLLGALLAIPIFSYAATPFSNTSATPHLSLRQLIKNNLELIANLFGRHGSQYGTVALSGFSIQGRVAALPAASLPTKPWPSLAGSGTVKGASLTTAEATSPSSAPITIISAPQIDFSSLRAEFTTQLTGLRNDLNAQIAGISHPTLSNSQVQFVQTLQPNLPNLLTNLTHPIIEGDVAIRNGGLDIGGSFLHMASGTITLDSGSIRAPSITLTTANIATGLALGTSSAPRATLDVDGDIFGLAGASSIRTQRGVVDPLTFTVASTTLPAGSGDGCAVIVGDYVYLFGGNAASTRILRAPLSNPTNFTNLGNLMPEATGWGPCAIVNGKIYMFGNVGGNHILSAPVSDPTNWTASANSMPGTGNGAVVKVIGDTIYAFAGASSGGIIYVASTTDPTTFVSSGVTLPVANAATGAFFKVGDYLYMVSHSGISPNVYRAPLSNPLSWSLYGAVANGTTVYINQSVQFILGDYAYITHGYFGDPRRSNIYRAPLTNMLDWKIVGTVPNQLWGANHMVQIGNRILLLGGNAGFGASNVIETVGFDSTSEESATWEYYPQPTIAGLAKLGGNYTQGDYLLGLTDNATNSLSLLTNSLKRLTIASSGFVGIATTGPTSTLQVNGTFHIANATGSILLADGSNNVGIGGASIGSKLEVKNSAAQLSALSLRTTDFALCGAGTSLDFGFGNSTGSTSAQLQVYTAGGCGGGNLILNPSAGNVGIGTAQPSSTLHVVGTSRFSSTANFLGNVSIGTSTTATLLSVATSSPIFNVLSSGLIGIGTSTPAYGLVLGDGNIQKDMYIPKGALCVDVNAAGCPANPTAGTIYASSTSLSQIDVAENYETEDPTIAPGDLVSSNPAHPQGIMKTTSATEQNVLGVISTAPGVLLGRTNTNTRAVALVGRVPVKVSTENGSIAIGDPLTISSEAGVAMKQTEPGISIGTALESLSSVAGSQITNGTIVVFVRTGFALGGGTVTASNEFSMIPEPTSFIDSFTAAIQYSLKKLGLALENGVAHIKEIVANKITGDEITGKKVTGDEVCAGTVCVNQEQLQMLLQNSGIQTPIVAPAPTPAPTDQPPTPDNSAPSSTPDDVPPADLAPAPADASSTPNP